MTSNRPPSRDGRHIGLEFRIRQRDRSAELGGAVQRHQHLDDRDAVGEGLVGHAAGTESFYEMPVLQRVAVDAWLSSVILRPGPT